MDLETYNEIRAGRAGFYEQKRGLIAAHGKEAVQFLDGMISYTKGCYIGQEIIARIHFRGHVAKSLTGITATEKDAASGDLAPGAELKTADGKNAGRITSVTISPKLQKAIGLAYIRYDYLS